MRRFGLLLVLLLVCAGPLRPLLCAREATLVADKPGTIVSERLLAEAQRILDHVRQTSYSHKTKVDEDEGEYHLDCSGLLCYILKRVAPDHLNAIPREKGHTRALAEDFQAAFEKASVDPKRAVCWLRIERLVDARAGDCLAWKQETPVPSGSTGHVIILSDTPVREADGQFRVALIDATETHHAEDARSERTGGGVGCGIMWFVVDEQGRPTGCRWSRRDGKLSAKPIAIARAVERLREE